METVLQTLHQKLLSFGALRPETWEALLPYFETTCVQAGESLVRQAGQIIYIEDGLFKEYDAWGRKHPAIINFLAAGDFFISGSHNLHHYLQACVPTVVVHTKSQVKWLLAYKELVPIYQAIQQSYITTVYLRQYILEEKRPQQRIELFKGHFQAFLPYMQKKEIANYLNMGYTHFTRLYQ